MSQPFKLYRLQQIDLQLDQARLRIKEIDQILSADQTLKNAQHRAEVTGATLENARKALRRAEENVNSQHIKIEQTEATLYGGKVRNPKELQDLQNEAAALKRYLSVLEDRQLEAMIVAEEAEDEHQLALDHLAKVRAESEHRHQELTAERESLLLDIKRMESERQAATTSIAPDDLQLYEQLRKRLRGLAVAKITEKACSACGSMLSTSLLHAARSPNKLNRCDTCNRILYSG